MSVPIHQSRISLWRHLKQRRYGSSSTKMRSPLPPIPRRFPFVEAGASVGTAGRKKGVLRRSWENGNILIGLGWFGVTLMAVDRLLQYHHRATIEDSSDMIKAIAEEASRRRTALYEECIDKPALYRCTVVREYKSMGGSHGLRDVKIGDVVEVLEENVGIGKDKNYHLCRVVGKEQIGWYPIGFMERIRIRRWWLF